MMENIIKENLKKEGLLEKRFILATSGGPDSMALVQMFSEILAPENLFVVSVDHGVRANSHKEAQESISFWKKRGLSGRCVSLRGLPFKEDILRKERYRALEEIRKNIKFDYIVTGHHMDDQAETVILKLLRGAGPIRVWGMKKKNGHILRPLLGFTKKDLLRYLSEKKINYFIDASNKDTKFKRNYLRKMVLPHLTHINKRGVENIAKTAALGLALSDYIEFETRKALENIKKGEKIEISKWNKLHPYIRFEVLKKYLEGFDLGKKEISANYLADLEKIFHLVGTKETEIGKTKFIKEYGHFGPAPKQKRGEIKSVSLGVRVVWKDKIINLTKKVAKAGKNNILINEEIAYNLSVRTPRPTDRIKTKIGTKKLTDLFVDAKIPRQKRKNWPIIVCSDKLIWVPGLAAYDKAIKEHKKEGAVIEIKDAKTERK